MNEKISVKKVLDSPNVYFPELERYRGEDVEVTITISVDSGRSVSVQKNLLKPQVSMRVTYETDDDDEPQFFSEEECGFEMT
jgi:hypothetical protein